MIKYTETPIYQLLLEYSVRFTFSYNAYPFSTTIFDNISSYNNSHTNSFIEGVTNTISSELIKKLGETVSLEK